MSHVPRPGYDLEVWASWDRPLGGQGHPSDNCRQASCLASMGSGSVPMVLRMPLCSIVKRLLHETSEGPCSPDAEPPGVVGSIRRWLGSPSIRRFPVTRAMIVFRLRALSTSF